MQTSGHRAVPCRCACGAAQDVFVFALRSGGSKSCGCWKREDLAIRKPRTTHGQARTPLYRLWLRINRRCNDSRAHNYRWYGARGIRVCDEWRHDAGAFIRYIEQNLGPRPQGMSLDRIDNDGNYEPGNVRWADQLQQVHNSGPYLLRHGGLPDC
jgi:hypothetical protein